MKKILGMLGLILLNNYTGVYVQAEESGAPLSAKSNVSVSFVGDDRASTQPINPANPDEQAIPDPGDPKNKGTGASGPLSIDYVTNFNFGNQQISNVVKNYSPLAKQPRIQVTDKRGVDSGWEVQARITQFKSTDGSATELKGAKFTLVTSDNGIMSNSENKSSLPSAPNTLTLTDSNQSVLKAKGDGDTGLGTWINNYDGQNTQLTVYPGTQKAKSYSAAITWDLSNGPES
ncbi:WxL domain-containing protein (plasmid) [Enterococcus faecalis]|uniref:WxL domain-containing protein n=1 Tax=Enterococcus faecalis TaxID=1351 RepID=UPI0024ACDE5C|nr:WxL domain-containing protein [Enterococcus faecalis]WHK76548.1 WxL domain-containing protein [Enterococcus faecalis]